MQFFAELQEELAAYLSPKQIERVSQAYILAAEAHRNQKRHSGEPYITHPVAVANELAKLRLDEESIMAAMLHDVIEDTGVEKAELAKRFGSEVAELVDGVSKLVKIKFESRAEAQAENFRKMFLAMVRDIRVIVIKLADRLHNMRTLEVLSTEKRRRIAKETLEIYAPIANRLGIHRFVVEFEELGFQALYPMRYRVLSTAVLKARRDKKRVQKQLLKNLETCVKKDLKIPCLIRQREHHIYSLYRMMQEEELTLNEIMETYPFHVIVDDRDTCYRVLGALHSLYKPMPARFRDYIAIPKANGYQSLHTGLFAQRGVRLDVQIRTQDMDKLADYGIVSYWLHKQAKSGKPNSEAKERTRDWIKRLLEMQQSAGDSIEFIENVKIDLFPDEIYVFTPKGEIMELPKGATPVDFAYAVHSDLGNSCVAAKINRHLAPLSTPLRNGQTVDIVKAPGARPNAAWLNFVVTGKARSNIRHFIKSQRRAESLAFGKRLFNQSLESLGFSLRKANKQQRKSLLDELHYESMDDLYIALGLGQKVAMLVAQRLVQLCQGGLEDIADSKAKPLVIKGTEGVVIQFADCCRPIPGDPIIGYLNKGRGLEIHVESCPVLLNDAKKVKHLTSVCWEDEVEGNFLVDLRLEVPNQRGILAALALAVSHAESDIDNVKVGEKDGQYTIVNLCISVKSRAHLARVMRRLRATKTIARMTRNNSLAELQQAY